MPSTMLAVVKPEAAPGAEIREVKIPLTAAPAFLSNESRSIAAPISIFTNGTAGLRDGIHPPLIPDTNSAAMVAAFAMKSTSVKEGDFVCAEMHVACGKCPQCAPEKPTSARA